MAVTRDCNRDIIRFLSAASQLHMRGFMGVEDDYNPVPQCPLWLTDRHLATEHTLQRVVFIKDMVEHMTQDFNVDLKRFLTENEEFAMSSRFPSLTWYSEFTIEGPTAFEYRYDSQIGKLCISLATNIHALPNQQAWCTPFHLRRHQPRPTFLNQSEVRLWGDEKKPYDFGLPEEVLAKMNPSVIDKLRIIRDGHNCLATFNFLPPCPASDHIVGGLLGYGLHDWKIPATISPASQEPFDRPLPLDAPHSWWSDYKVPTVSKDTQLKRNRHTQRTTAFLPARQGTRHPYQPRATEFIQRAWCRAVETDATFMVLNSGRKERIGIRHRASNTLFISPLIDPFSMPYMSVHMTLHSAILKDAMARASAPPPEVISPLGLGHKRKLHEHSTGKRSSKRLRGDPHIQHEDKSFDIQHEISSRHILLISFDFHVYHSTRPSTFLRVSPSCLPDFVTRSDPQPKPNKPYPLTKCMHFIAKEKLGAGRAGTAFRGILRIQTDSGNDVETSIVLKIPLGAQPAQEIHDEYKTYRELAVAGANEGLVPVYGVFEDIETNAVAMMLHDGGTDLWQRERKRDGGSLSSSWQAGQISLSQDEFDALHGIIQRINKAGLLHLDIKPNNILIDSDGNLTLIDFDSAYPREWEDGDPDSPDMLTLHDLFARTFIKDKHYPR